MMAASDVSGGRIPVADVAHMMSALGEAKALDVITKAARELHFSSREFESQQVLLLLERIAAEPGLIGITARFAKARAVLRWPTHSHGAAGHSGSHERLR